MKKIQHAIDYFLARYFDDNDYVDIIVTLAVAGIAIALLIIHHH